MQNRRGRGSPGGRGAELDGHPGATPAPNQTATILATQGGRRGVLKAVMRPSPRWPQTSSPASRFRLGAAPAASNSTTPPRCRRGAAHAGRRRLCHHPETRDHCRERPATATFRCPTPVAARTHLARRDVVRPAATSSSSASPQHERACSTPVAGAQGVHGAEVVSPNPAPQVKARFARTPRLRRHHHTSRGLRRE